VKASSPSSSSAPRKRRKAGTPRRPDPGLRATAFFGELRHTKGEWAGQQFWEAYAPQWQVDLVRQVFGTLRPDGTRQYRRVYIEVPRKNGKSTLAAAFALYLLYLDGEPGAEVYSCAADRDQAAIVFEQAKAMVEASPELLAISEIYRRSIVVPGTGSSYKVLSADAPTKHGLHAHAVIFDELHAQPNRELWDVLTTSTGARRQPLVIAITTAGYDRHSICWELHDYAIKVRDGVIQDDSFLPVIFAADPEADWTAEATWKAANPCYGVTVKAEYLAAECARAQESPAYQNTFRRLHLSQWTEQAERWIDLALWDANAGVVNRAALAGQPCWMGLDLSTTTDLTAAVLVFKGPEGFICLPHFWLPEESLEKRVRRDRVPYDVWARDGLLEVTPGNVVDYHYVRERIRLLGKEFRVKEVAIDPWNATQLAQQLQDDRFTVVEMRQGFASLSAPTKELMTVLLGHRMAHGGHPVLRWMAANVTVKQDPAGNLKPDKERSQERIDGIVALIMALGRAMASPQGGSVYDTRDPIVLG
jgi:phage terminase large subunit-like protein